MTDSPRLVGVTGSSGYLGGSLINVLRANHVDVVSYQRSEGVGVRPLDLDQPMSPDLFNGVSCLIHGAWDLKEVDPRRSWNRNVEGSKKVLVAASRAGVSRFIFISSMSAYFGTKQNYGLMKMAVERAVLEAGQVVVRPGLVYGGDPGGMAGTLSKLARLPVIPVFKGATQYTLHIDDYLHAMTSLIDSEIVPSTVFGLGHEPPTDFRDVMITLARDQNRSPRTVTIPWLPLRVALETAERLRLPLPVRSDSLLGLVRPAKSLPGRDASNQLGLSFRDFGA